VLAAVLRIAISESGFVLVISWFSVTTNCSQLNFLIVERYTNFCLSKVHLVLQSISFVAHQSMAALSFKSLTIIFSTECERKSTCDSMVDSDSYSVMVVNNVRKDSNTHSQNN
jgi:hypothetical protein